MPRRIPVEQLDPRDYIIVKGAKVNNLKNLDVAIPRNQLVVLTGVSGSGKSSLAFDTLFAEGQRMYVESLSAYARQFLGRMEKPDVEYIRGISPAIAVEQKVTTKNPRSTVGTTTEIYDYLKLLFARIGHTFSPISGQEVRKSSVSDIVDFVNTQPEGTRYLLLAPFVLGEGRDMTEECKLLLQQGFSRIYRTATQEVHYIEELLVQQTPLDARDWELLIDRSSVSPQDEDAQYRLSDSVQTALYEGHGECILEVVLSESRERHRFSDRFEADGITFEEPSVNFFSFNNPYGACKRCEGYGNILGIDPNLVIPDKSLSIYEGAIAPWRGEVMGEYRQRLIEHAWKFDFPVHRPYEELSPEQQQLLWTGNQYFEGIDAFFAYLESKLHKIQYRVMLSRYRGRTTCPECRGTRLRKDATYVKIGGKSITDLVLLPVKESCVFFQQLQLGNFEQQVAQRLLTEIQNRLGYLEKVGLGYITLNRLTSTLSGGEFQRIKLATSLGSALVGSMYILDEPSIGLHPRDTHNLIGVLRELQQMGNTVIVVEHEEEVMRAADQLIDIGPDAGVHGGELVFQGTLDEALSHDRSYTGRYLSGRDSIPIPTHRRAWNESLVLHGARENNLKNITVAFPLGTLTCVTGVSGSGKSTLVKKCLLPALAKHLGNSISEEVGYFEKLDGALKRITQVEFVDQNPIGKSSRSNPVTYVKAYDAIRELYSQQPISKQRGYTPAFFSFNVDGGRCDACQGEGTIKVEMQFMADIYLPCESCHGKRFKADILDATYKGKHIADVLEMSIDEALEFFADKRKIVERLQPLQQVGLGYIRLGQSSNTLSGGEAQRVKLASFLVRGNLREHDRLLFIFDEPTTGLHFHDIRKLLDAFQALIEHGHSILVIEHNMEIIKCADWVIDLGPEGGEAGGQLCFQGTPEQLAAIPDNHTAMFLKGILKG